MRLNPGTTWAAAAVLLTLSACGWEADGGARLVQLYHPDTGKDAVADAAPDVPGEVPEDPGSDTATDVPTTDEGGLDLDPGDIPATGLAGTWAGRVVQEGELTPLFQPWPVTTTDYFLAEVAEGASTMRLTLCREVPVVHDEDPELDFVTRMPDKTATALAAVPLDWTLAGGAASLPAQKVVWTWGLKDLAAADPLPRDPAAATVFDQDGDGNPGVTMTVLQPVAGERYLVKRATWDLAAGALSTDRIWLTGTLAYTLEEEPLAANPSTLKAATPITPKEGSAYAFRRVGDLTCADLVAHAAEVFATAP